MSKNKNIFEDIPEYELDIIKNALMEEFNIKNTPNLLNTLNLYERSKYNENLIHIINNDIYDESIMHSIKNDIYDKTIISDDNVKLYKYDHENIIFSKSIYDSKNKKLNYMENNLNIKKCEKIVEFLSVFYKKVDVLIIVDASFSRFLGNSKIFSELNSHFKPKFKINRTIIKIMGKDLIYKENKINLFMSYIDDYTCFEIFNNELKKGEINDFFEHYIKNLVPKEYQYKIDENQSIEEVKDNLNLLKMFLI